jgi:excisionase family DNA binding protein
MPRTQIARADRQGPLLSILEAAAYLGISPGTLRNWLSMRRLAYVKVGRLTKLAIRDLDAFIASHTIREVTA